MSNLGFCCQLIATILNSSKSWQKLNHFENEKFGNRLTNLVALMHYLLIERKLNERKSHKKNHNVTKQAAAELMSCFEEFEPEIFVVEL